MLEAISISLRRRFVGAFGLDHAGVLEEVGGLLSGDEVEDVRDCRRG